ncbi:ATP-binding protein [Brevibacterium album]|uniref:ATP-binding protein n=1 Tax=Brevibacterium album TaxID=417948 RepID=UPI00048BF973|nr:ATP-binding protein [Brevibacterium album]
MDQLSNPYTPNAGATPEVIVGRDDQLDAFSVLLGRLARGRSEQSMIATGLRGVGKTVLLTRLGEIAREQDWQVVDLEAGKYDEAHFRTVLFGKLRTVLLTMSPRARWTARSKRAASVLTSFTLTASPDGSVGASLQVDPAEGLADHGDLSLDLTDVLVELGHVAKERTTGIVLTVDEVQFLRTEQLSALIQAIHKTVQLKLPLTFVGAGLPQIAELAGDARSYAERLFKFPVIGELGDDDARRAFADPAAAEGVSFDDDALDRAVELTQGYPYFIQELGYAVWTVAENNRITKRDIDIAEEAYVAKLDSSFFKVRLDRATPLETAYMRAMAELGPEPQKAADVARVMERDSSQLGPTRAKLINMGLLYTPNHGYAAFTVPTFDSFMRRTIPQEVILQWRQDAGRHT